MDRQQLLWTIGGIGAVFVLNRMGHGSITAGSLSDALLGAIPEPANPLLGLARRQAAEAVAQAICPEAPQRPNRQQVIRPRRVAETSVPPGEPRVIDAEWSPVHPTDRTST